MQKLLYFRLFCKEITKPCVKFSRVWTKNTIYWANCEKILDETSIEKLNLYLFLENLLLKIETSEITSFFYNNFSRFGGGVSPLPLAMPLDLHYLTWLRNPIYI